MKQAVVTGATKGLGLAIAETLASAGYDLHLSARSTEALDRIRQKFEAAHGITVYTEAVDFSNEEAVKAYGTALASLPNPADVLVNNLGIFMPDTVDGEMKLGPQMQVNFYGAYHLTQPLLPRFIEAGSGHIFNILSVVNRKPRTDAASYTISKFAMLGYHKLLQKTLLPHGVKVTGFYPSSINTSSWDGIDAPKEEFVQPEDIAGLIANILEMKRGTVAADIDLNSINPDF